MRAIIRKETDMGFGMPNPLCYMENGMKFGLKNMKEYVQ